MQFRTIRDSFDSKLDHRLSGGRGAYYGRFHYHLESDQSVERLTVCAQPALVTGADEIDERYFKAFVDGVLSAIKHEEARGYCLCCVRATITSVTLRSSLDALLSENMLYLSGGSFYRECLRVAKLIEPLRPEWLTSDVIALARGVHADAAFDRLPILSDALRDAGCEDALIHDHLRLCPDHGPSCWVVEMILEQARTTATGSG